VAVEARHQIKALPPQNVSDYLSPRRQMKKRSRRAGLHELIPEWFITRAQFFYNDTGMPGHSGGMDLRSAHDDNGRSEDACSGPHPKLTIRALKLYFGTSVFPKVGE
jgi:hypothetical protein